MFRLNIFVYTDNSGVFWHMTVSIYEIDLIDSINCVFLDQPIDQFGKKNM